jgi:hypothetical protein
VGEVVVVDTAVEAFTVAALAEADFAEVAPASQAVALEEDMPAATAEVMVVMAAAMGTAGMADTATAMDQIS